MADNGQNKPNKEKDPNRVLLFVTKVIGSISLRVIVIAILAIVFIYAVIRAYDFGYSIFTVKSTEEGEGMDVLVSVTEDMSTADIADLLVKKKLIDDASIFKIQVSLFTSDKYVILPGTYTLNTTMSPQEMIQEMVGVPESESTEPEHLWPAETTTAAPETETSPQETSPENTETAEDTRENTTAEEDANETEDD